jgi:CubicO group peptidase (beta-lactamase class C family)
MIILVLAFVSGYAMASEVSGEAKIKEMQPEFEKYVQEAMNTFGVPGMAIAIVQDDKLVYAKGFGTKEVNGTDPISPNTVFQIGSCSKAFGAALLAMEVDKGKIGWDDKVIDYLPEFRMYDPWVTREFTITDLLSHRSGLPEQFGAALIALDYNTSQMIKALRYGKPVTSFRSAFAYQNIMYVVAGNITEKLTGKAWNESVRDMLFVPLEMSNSSADFKSFIGAKDKALPHWKINGTYQTIPLGWKYLDWVYPVGPAGAINSNVYDMSKWVIMQMNNGTYKGSQIISENSTKYMQTPKTIVEPGAYYCLGWGYREYRPYPAITHEGGASGFNSLVGFVPQAKIGIVILTNTATSGMLLPLFKEFLNMYFDSPRHELIAIAKTNKTGVLYPELPSPPSPPLSLDSYEGNYTNDIYGTLNIEAENGSLVTAIGPKKSSIELKHWNRDTFIMNVPDIPDSAGDFASFQIGPDGKAVSLDAIGSLNSKFEKV